MEINSQFRAWMEQVRPYKEIEPRNNIVIQAILFNKCNSVFMCIGE